MKMKAVSVDLSIAIDPGGLVASGERVDFSSSIIHICSLGNFGVFSL